MSVIVCVEPLPEWTLKFSRRLRPMPRPIFEGPGTPTTEDVELALALIANLDPESRVWYRSAEEALQERLRGQ